MVQPAPLLQGVGFEDSLEGEGHEEVALRQVELWAELHPGDTQEQY